MNIRPLFATALREIATTVHAQVPLGTAQAYGVPGASTVTNTGPTGQSGGSARHRLGSERSYTSRSAR